MKLVGGTILYVVLLLQVEELELCAKNSFHEFISPRRIERWKEEEAGKEKKKRMREKEGKEKKGERECCEIQMSLKWLCSILFQELMLYSDHYELGSVLIQVTATITLLIALCI